MSNPKTFTVYDNVNGRPVVCKILFSFTSHLTLEDYIVYTDDTYNQDDRLNVYASRYECKEGNHFELLPIETDEEWEVINVILNLIQQGIRDNETVEEIAHKIDASLADYAEVNDLTSEEDTCQ